MNEQLPEILTLRETADYLRVHPGTIYRMVKKTGLPSFRIGRDIRFRRADLEHWIEGQTK